MNQPFFSLSQLPQPRRCEDISSWIFDKELSLLFKYFRFFYIFSLLETFESFSPELLQICVPLLLKTHKLLFLTFLHLIVYLIVLQLNPRPLSLKLISAYQANLFLNCLSLLKSIFLVLKAFVSIISQDLDKSEHINWGFIWYFYLPQNGQKMVKGKVIAL